MMFCLVLNVSSDFVYIGLTDRKTSVSALPLELFVIRIFARLHPLGTGFLDLFNNLFERMILGERKQCVDVIFDTSDYQRWTFPLSEYTCLISEETVADILGNPWRSMLGAVD
jgi:hypothetical protein